MPIHYSYHHGRHQVPVVYCPSILGNRLAHLSQDGPASWALRDFIIGQMIRNSPSPNLVSSTHSLAQIEAEVIYSEPPPFYAVENNVDDWAIYLRLRTMAVLVPPVSSEPPNPQFGNWRSI